MNSHYIPPPSVPVSARAAVTVRQAIGDLPPIVRRNWRISAGPPSRDTRDTTNYAQGRPSAYAAAMRDWDGFQPRGPVQAHVARHTPRDYGLFSAMGPGEQYPKLHRRALGRFERQVEWRRRRGETLRENGDEWLALKASMVPPYDPGKFPNKWRKLDAEQPSCTLTAHLGKDSYSHIHYDPQQARTISVREAARLQSFPDGFIFEGSLNAAFRQIGNAVPPFLAYAVAKCVVELLGTAVATIHVAHDGSFAPSTFRVPRLLTAASTLPRNSEWPVSP